MAKKKIKNALKTLFSDSSPQESETTETNDSYMEIGTKKIKKKKGDNNVDILERRLKNRDIPMVDDGIRYDDKSYEGLMRWYSIAHVEEYVKSQGKYIKFEFGSMLDGYRTSMDEDGENEIIRKISYAEISKKSFINNINVAIRYINYFIEYFDDDDELMHAYYTMMFQLHFKNAKMSVEDFIDAVFATIATESMVEKVIRMVEYNTDESLVKQDKTYDESIQLTVEHLKAIMGIGCFHKFVIPIVSHYYTLRRKELEQEGWDDRKLYFEVFASFIPLFDDYYDISLYGKLYHTSTTRISKTEIQESAMWKRRNRFGTTSVSFTNDLMNDFLNDISQKTVFNRSAIIYIHVCFDKAIHNELIQSDKHEMSDMRMDASDNVNETISRWDRWQMDKTMHSEKDRLRARVSIIDSIVRLGREVGLEFDRDDRVGKFKSKALQDEYDYYRDNMQQPLCDAQMYIIQLYYASKMQSTEEVKIMEVPDQIKLIMIMKRDLVSRNYNYLPFFISGKVKYAASRKNNKKKVEKLFAGHPLWDDWMDEYPDTFDLMNMDKFFGEMKTILSCPIEVVDWEHIDLRGRQMTPAELPVVDEIMRLMYSV